MPRRYYGYTRRYRSYPRTASRRLSYPRGMGRYASVKSRGPFRVNNAYKPELKVFDFSSPPFPIGSGNTNGTFNWVEPANNNPWDAWTGTNSGGTITQLNVINQGTQAYQRIGNRVNNKSLWLTFAVRSWSDRPQEITVPCSFRVMVVQDMQPNGSDPQVSTILEPIAFDGVNTTVLPMSPHSLDNRDRFRTLMDVRDTLNPNGDEIKTYEKFIPLNFTTTYYTGAAGIPITNAIFLLCVSDQPYIIIDNSDPENPVNTYPQPYVKFSSRLRFTDP